MIVERFSYSSHMQMAKIMFQARGMCMIESLIDDLPKNGFIASNCDEPIAMGFIRTIEGRYGMLDSYISDPRVAPEIRNEFLDIITYRLISLSKDLGITKIFAFSEDSNTIDRAKKHGFGLVPFKFTVLDLNRGG